MQPTLFILTGGTIDAEAYETTPVDVTPLARSLVPETVKKLFPDAHDHCRFVQWEPMLDSKYITEDHLDNLARQIFEAPESRVVVTCGTDFMPRHAQALQDRLRILEDQARAAGAAALQAWSTGPRGKTIVFTGAMEPLLHGPERSDGERNLRSAMLRLSLLEMQHRTNVATRDRSETYLIGREEKLPGIYAVGTFRSGEAEKDLQQKVFRRIEQPGTVEASLP